MEENNNIAKNYDPKEFEDRLYAWWEEQGYFTPVVDKNKKPFTIMMPPPIPTMPLKKPANRPTASKIKIIVGVIGLFCCI